MKRLFFISFLAMLMFCGKLVASDKILFGWGNNESGQLADWTIEPKKTSTSKDVAYISSGCYFTIALADAPTNIEEPIIKDNFNISLYPNPTKNKIELQINFSELTKADIKVYDLQGNELISVFAGNLPKGETKLQINCETLSNGTYNVVIQMKDRSIMKRFVVQR